MKNEADTGTVLHPARKSRLRSVIFAVTLLVSGFFLGASVALLAVRNAAIQAARHPEKSSERTLRRLRWQLRLSDEQAGKVSEILAKHQPEFLAIRREAQPRVLKELREIQDEVSPVLDENQRKKWDRIIGRLRDFSAYSTPETEE